MRKIHLSSIQIKPNRQRLEFDPESLQELANSIEDRGLLHPPVVRQEGEEITLVAGERRLRAITQIFELGGSFTYNGETFQDGVLPVNNLGDLSELEAEEAELDENLKRKDLTWQEHAKAVARLHALRQKQAEGNLEELLESPDSAGLDASQIAEVVPKHTVAATAQEVYGSSVGAHYNTTREEILLAQHLDNPVVASAKSPKEAFKALKRLEEAEANRQLAAEIGKSFSADDHRLFNQDCLTFMADPANHGYFDVILTDPPYGMGAQNFADAGGKLTGIEHHYDDSYESWKPLMREWSKLSFLVTKPEAHAYVFCDIDNFHELRDMMAEAGWTTFRTPLINVKSNSGRVPLPEHGPRRQYEILLYAFKGKKPVNFIYPDVITTQADKNLSHGAQKPVELYENLLLRSVRPGDKVLDSFAGSGTIFPACHTYKCEATGLELNPEYFALCIKRIDEIRQAASQLELLES